MRTEWIRIVGEFKTRWWLRPICWVFKHKKEWTRIYGVRYKQCSRCGKDFLTKKATEVEVKFRNCLYRGEIGQLYGVRFFRDKFETTKK